MTLRQCQGGEKGFRQQQAGCEIAASSASGGLLAMMEQPPCLFFMTAQAGIHLRRMPPIRESLLATIFHLILTKADVRSIIVVKIEEDVTWKRK
jgi:hypothetical protein